MDTIKTSIDRQIMIDALNKLTDEPAVEIEPRSINNFRVMLFNHCMKNNIQIKTKKIKGTTRLKVFKIA